MIELPKMTFCKILPELPKPLKLRRQVRKDGGYDMVPAYTDEEMFKYGEVCAAEARGQMREECATAIFDSIHKVPKEASHIPQHITGIRMGFAQAMAIIKELP